MKKKKSRKKNKATGKWFHGQRCYPTSDHPIPSMDARRRSFSVLEATGLYPHKQVLGLKEKEDPFIKRPTEAAMKNFEEEWKSLRRMKKFEKNEKVWEEWKSLRRMKKFEKNEKLWEEWKSLRRMKKFEKNEKLWEEWKSLRRMKKFEKNEKVWEEWKSLRRMKKFEKNEKVWEKWKTLRRMKKFEKN